MLLTIGILLGSGLLFYFIIGHLVDGVVYRIAIGDSDPLLDLFTGTPNPRRRIGLNVVRPIILTLIIFGCGLLTIAQLQLSKWVSVGAGVWYFFLTQIACLSGRNTSLNEAGWAMVITILLLIVGYNVLA